MPKQDNYVNTIMRRLIITIVIILLVAPAIVLADDFGDLPYYEKADPNKDFKDAVSRNDLRFIALRGYSVYVPGVNDYREKYIKYGYKTISGTSDMVMGYEHGRLIRIAQYYAETYNLLLLIYISQLESRTLSTDLPGYTQLISIFSVDDTRTGSINMLPFSFHAKLTARNKKCVNLAWWFNPIENEQPRYDWTHFLKTYEEVNDAVCSHRWIQEWIDAGTNRNAEAHILGNIPFTDTQLDVMVGTAWHSAELKSEPYYEVNLRDGERWVAKLFIGRDCAFALVTDSEAQTNNHWLDSHKFHFHPIAPNSEYIVVDQKGNWRLMKMK